MMKLFGELLAALPGYQSSSDDVAGVLIRGITADSREVERGTLFVAYQGVNSDLHRFIPDAVARGAAAIIAEKAPAPGLAGNVPVVVVPNGRAALAWLAAAWYDHPSRQLVTIGVTGTDGKTTTSNLIASILQAMGRPHGMVSTISARIGQDELDTGFHTTTPDALPLQHYLHQMVTSGSEIAVLEVTSHSLAQHRVDSVAFDIAVVTNITHEHLDAHGSIEAYRAAKTRLFQQLSTQPGKPGLPKTAILNLDDSSYAYLSSQPAERRLTYSASGDARADIRAQGISYERDGTRFQVESPGGTLDIRTSLVGPFNVANILAAIATAVALGATPGDIEAGVAALQHVYGRMDRVELGQEFLAVVDFAHTPNALERALETARQLIEPPGRVIAVFGCAGLRDVPKRAMMGAAAARLADLTVITAEDPRTEDLGAIMEEIAAGARSEGGAEGESYVKIGDRAEAIAWAVEQARPGDIVICCGKGHEQSMCFGETEYPWSEHAALEAALTRRLGRE